VLWRLAKQVLQGDQAAVLFEGVDEGSEAEMATQVFQPVARLRVGVDVIVEVCFQLPAAAIVQTVVVVEAQAAQLFSVLEFVTEA